MRFKVNKEDIVLLSLGMKQVVGPGPTKQLCNLLMFYLTWASWRWGGGGEEQPTKCGAVRGRQDEPRQLMPLEPCWCWWPSSRLAISPPPSLLLPATSKAPWMAWLAASPAGATAQPSQKARKGDFGGELSIAAAEGLAGQLWLAPR